MDDTDFIRGTGPAEITLNVRNLSTVVQRTGLRDPFRAFMRQVNNDLHLYWNNEKGLQGEPFIPFVTRIREVRAREEWDDKAWRATILDYPTQAFGVSDLRHMPLEALTNLGYHYYDQDEKVPQMVVFAAMAQNAGIPWTLTFSHELLETLGDRTTLTRIVAHGNNYEVEICDPVQFHGYPINGVWVSNFVTPAWFQVAPSLGTGWNKRAVAQMAPPGPTSATQSAAGQGSADDAVPYDFANLLTAPRQRAVGGSRTRRIRGSDVTEELRRSGSVSTALP